MWNMKYGKPNSYTEYGIRDAKHEKRDIPRNSRTVLISIKKLYISIHSFATRAAIRSNDVDAIIFC